MLSALCRFAEPAWQSSQTIAIANDPAEGNVLVEALVCEFHWTALRIGAITSCMNASLVSGGTRMLKTCGNLLPVEAPVVRLALRAWRDIGMPSEA